MRSNIAESQLNHNILAPMLPRVRVIENDLSYGVKRFIKVKTIMASVRAKAYFSCRASIVHKATSPTAKEAAKLGAIVRALPIIYQDLHISSAYLICICRLTQIFPQYCSLVAKCLCIVEEEG